MKNFLDKAHISGEGDQNTDVLIMQKEQIINELNWPYKDPRETQDFIRDKTNIATAFSQKELMYCLIDETERTFKNGMIVSATVVRKFEKKDQHQQVKYVCRLENGLDATVFENEADFYDLYGERAKEIDKGYVIQGRVNINYLNSEDKFNVILKCKYQDMVDH